MNTKERIYDELTNLSMVMGQKQEEKRIMLYTEELALFDFNSVIKSIREMRRTSKFFPSLAEIIENIKTGGVPIDEVAVQIANEIIECISKFGPYQLEEVKAYLGDRWGVVERSGGWTNLCNITYDEIPSTKAQLRELAKSYLNRSKRENKGGELVINSTSTGRPTLEKLNINLLTE
jgi:hypothetical protein